jgi:hypothetical protein
MVQPLRPFEDTGKPRTGSNAGGVRQKYVLDEPGRRLILARYDGKSETISELAERLAVPRWVVKKWGCELGLARQREPRWTTEDEEYLRRNLHRSSLGDIAKKLGRTKVAVKLKAKRLGVNKCEQVGYTMRGLCMGLGCDHKQVERWLERGWLKGTHRHTERATRDVWYFSDAAIRRFVMQHPQEVDQRRFDWLWVVDVLTGGLGELGTMYGESEQEGGAA